ISTQIFTLSGSILDATQHISKKDILEKSLVEALKAKVRTILGVEELTKLRDHLIKQASNAINA
ncbi:MAG: hypothetical protein V7542_11880, partial [Limnobacter sp.]|uniref:hypothetical protein n=1 Tax=Limnobacter sp. TaxID=2003368 RepID=UPI003001BFFA